MRCRVIVCECVMRGVGVAAACMAAFGQSCHVMRALPVDWRGDGRCVGAPGGHPNCRAAANLMGRSFAHSFIRYRVYAVSFHTPVALLV